MFDAALKPLLESGIINEETRQAIHEAWEARLSEARDEIRAELREEFAQKYDHDKQVMSEALDRMVSDQLAGEISEFAEERKGLREDRVKAQRKLKEDATRFNQFLVKKLAEELSELRSDRKVHQEGMERLEKFVIHALSRELAEFATDKKAVVESKVRLVREAKVQLAALKKRFVTENADKMRKVVVSQLRSELTQLHEDIRVARENNFGRRIFEAFASEFNTTYLSEKAEVRKLLSALQSQKTELDEAKKTVSKAKQLVESKEKEIARVREIGRRKEILEGLLKPLNKEKSGVMRELLENVQTDRLSAAFEKYLPAVLNESAPKATKKPLTESKVVTGDKRNTATGIDDSDDNIIEIRRLAGLK